MVGGYAGEGGQTPAVRGSGGLQVARPHRMTRRGTSVHGSVSTWGGKNPLNRMFCLS